MSLGFVFLLPVPKGQMRTKDSIAKEEAEIRPLFFFFQSISNRKANIAKMQKKWYSFGSNVLILQYIFLYEK